MTGSRALRLGAILIGAGVDIGGTVVVWQLGLMVMVVATGAYDVPETELRAVLHANTGFLLGQLLLGLAFSAAAGFIAARIARNREGAHAAVTGGVCVIGTWVLAALVYALPSWYVAVACVMVLPLAWLGGSAARRRNASTAA